MNTTATDKISETRVNNRPTVTFGDKLATIRQYLDVVKDGSNPANAVTVQAVDDAYHAIIDTGFEYVDPYILKLAKQKAWNEAKRAQVAAEKAELAALRAQVAALNAK